MTMGAAELVKELAGLYASREAPDSDQRTAAYWWGAQDQDIPWALSLCAKINPEPAQALYIAHVAEDVRYASRLKEWAYRAAVEYAGSKGGGQRKRSQVEAYRPDWGHQAARDGLALALWPHVREDVPGIGKRAEQFKCGKQCYQRVRDEVSRQASDMIVGFRMDMEQCRTGVYSRDFRGRWETATGAVWREC
jgi:hypothetical protein